MNCNPYQVVRDFEKALCDYTGARYAVTTTSCTMALLLAIALHLRDTKIKLIPYINNIQNSYYISSPRLEIEIPKRTYVSVPMSIIHAGGRPTFRDEEWLGYYQLKPFPVFDSARWFSHGMFDGDGAWVYGPMPFMHIDPNPFVCVSFHATKILGDTQGGAILHNSDEADAWFRRMRFDGRTEGVAPKDDVFREVGFHCYLSPDVAARLLLHLSVLPKHNPPLPNDDYPDLSKLDIFK